MAVALGLFGSLTVFSPGASAQHYMFGRADFATGVAPQSVMTADLNGDGVMDLAVANQNGNSVSILLGKPDGTFAPKVDYPVGASPRMVIAGDFNRDGKLDLAVVNYGSSSVSVLLGNGDGTFQAHVDYGAGSGALSVVAADFNGDGKIDLAVANSGANTVSALLGNGDGTFQTHVDYMTGPEPSSVTAADFNADGKLDLAVANANCSSSPCGPGSVSVLLGNGNGTFQTHADHATGTGPSSVATADFNSDGKPDLAVANSTDNTVSVLRGNGDGTFQAHQDTAVGSGPDWVTVNDFNRDGKPDLAVANQTANTVSILVGNGDGTWQAHVDYYVGSGPRGIAVADFNGDGPVDVAVANSGSNTISVLLGKDDGTLEDVIQYPLWDGAAISITAGDFNRDGKLDLAVANQNCNPTCQAGPVSILLGNGDGTFGAHVDYVTGNGPTSVITGDFSRDGILDLALADFNSNTVSLLLGNGDGTFRPHVDYATGQGPLAVTTGDFNGDGKPDLAVAVDSTFGVAAVLLGNGDGTFQAPVSYSVGTLPRAIVAGDFNSDGKLDLAISNKNDNTISILLGNGDGTFHSQVTYPTGNGPFSMVAADFNGDGKLDLATANQFGGSVSVLLGNGDGTFKAPVNYTAGSVPLGVTTGDFNGDGKLDLAVASGQSGSVSILEGNGDGTFQSHIDYSAGPGTYPYSVVRGDFTGVGGSDVAVATEAGVSVVLNSPVIAIFPSKLVFGSQAVGTTSAAQSLTLANPSSERLRVASIIASGDFAASNTCGSSLAIGATCTVAVTFTPTAAGTRKGTLIFTDGAASSPQGLSLTGAGLFSGPGASLSSSSLGFPSEPVGTTSPAQTVTLSNPGNSSLNITSISTSGDFAQTNNCGGSVAVGASCTLSVTFTPTSSGTRTGVLSVADNAAGSPQTVSLSGTGNVPVASLSPTSLTFANQPVATTSGAQAATLTNTGGASLSINNIAVNGDFAQTNNCGSTLASGTHCAINVTFTPTASGIRTGTLTVTDNASGSPQSTGLTGTGNVPVASVSPSSLSFGSQMVGAISAAQTVTLSNTGGAMLTITSITASGDFAQTNNCGSSLAASASCAINVTFTPTASGTRSGSLTFADNAAGSPQSIGLNGSGVVSAVSLSPSSLSFGNQALGTTSAAEVVTLSNTGGATLAISGIGTSGDFTQSNNCGSSAAAGANCTINVSFTPTASGMRNGMLTITDNASGSPQSVSLTGTGAATAPVASASPSSLSFGNQPVGTVSSPQVVTLSNTGNATLSVSSIAASGDFAQTNNCGSSVAAGAHCTIDVTFAPTTSGTRSGTLSLADNAPGSPQSVSLSGSGILSAPTVSVSPLSLKFGNQPVGTTSAPQSVTLANTGSGMLEISGISTTSGSFAQVNNCGSVLAAGASCTVNVTFAPASSGPLGGALLVADNPGGGLQVVGLTGAGAVPMVSLSPTALGFFQTFSTPNVPQAVTLTNIGGAPLTISSVSISSSTFAERNNCGTSLAAGASCTITVAFTWTFGGALSDTLSIVDNAAGSPHTVSLSVAWRSPLASLSASGLNFDNQSLSPTIGAQTVALVNAGGVTLSLSAITAGPGGFDQTNDCPSSLQVGAGCSIHVTFTPSAFGLATGTLTISDSDSGSPHRVALAGNGAGPAVMLSASSLNFSSQPVGSTSAADTVALVNIGSAALNITGIAASGDFAQSNNCGNSVAPGAGCIVSVTFIPTGTGTRVGGLTFTDNASDSPQGVSLTGIGGGSAGPAVSLSPFSLTFSSQPVGTTSPAQTVTLTDTGSATLSITAIATDGDFAQTNNCGSSVTAGGTCSVNVTFTPTTSGSRTGTITVIDNAPGSPQSVSLSGTGTLAVPIVILSPNSVDFGSLAVGASSAPQSVTLTNSGGAALVISSIATTSGSFVQSNNCGGSVAAGSSCSISVTFVASVAGAANGLLVLTDNASGSPHEVSLSGAGGAPVASLSASNLYFRYQVIGTTSNPQAVTLSNTGTSPLNIASISASGDFAETSNCGGSLPTGASCTIEVTYSPTALYIRRGTLSVVDNASGGAQTVALVGFSIP